MDLLSVQGNGALYTVILLVLCFCAVHLFELARIGYRYRKNLPAEPPKEEPKTSEPVYFIVEKKKKRPKTTYREPQEISFKSTK